MDPIPSSSSSHVNYGAEKTEIEKQQIAKEIEIYAVEIFMNMWKEESGGGSDSSSKGKKIQNVTKLLEQGKISIAEAAAEILAILQGGDTKRKAATEAMEKGDTAQHLLNTINIFSASLHLDTLKNSSLIQRTEMLFQHLTQHSISNKQAASEYNKLAKEANENLPKYLHFPEFPPQLFS